MDEERILIFVHAIDHNTDIGQTGLTLLLTKREMPSVAFGTWEILDPEMLEINCKFFS